ncbi:MAG: hypothetical protein J6B37_02505 [Clostridia bacterium]|nr:hypothetical protein [Clostridia bacterium]
MQGDYDDIINLPHHQSDKRPHMSLYDRAAQFAPFSALTGHDDAIKETARLTDKKLELDDYEQMLLNNKMNFILNHINEQPEITVTYFIPDSAKAGGMYLDFAGNIKKFDSVQRVICFTDKTEIAIDDIIEIKSELLSENAEVL